MKRCYLFPGQGAQYPGMAKDFYEASGNVRSLFEEASDVTGMDLRRLLFEGSEEELKSTDKTQVAVTLANCSSSIYLKEHGISADGAAGHSLGEYSALWEAGVLDNKSLFAIVKARGQLMQKASRNLDSSHGQAGMAAVVGLAYEDVVKVLEDLKGEEIYLANYNSPIQVVVAGTAAGLDKAEGAFDEAGAMKYVRLKVSGPFHTPLLEEARDGLEEVLKKHAYSNPVKPVYANVTGKEVKSGDEAKELCVRQVVSPVLWVEEEQSILDAGYDQILESGPGKILSGLWKSFHRAMKCQQAGTVEKAAALLG